MKKLLFLFLLIIAFIPFYVSAEVCDSDKISISNITLKEKTDSVKELSDAKVVGNKVNLNLSMKNKGDKVVYRFVVNNDSDKDFIMSKNYINLNSEFVSLTIKSKDNSNIVKANSNKIVDLIIEYKNEVSSDTTINDTSTMIINSITNPKTSFQWFLVVLVFILVIISLFLVLKRKKTINFVIFFFVINILIPIGVYAACKYEFAIVSSIKLIKPTGIDYIENVGLKCGLVKDEHDEYRFTGNNTCNYISFNNELWRVIGIFNTKENGSNTLTKHIKIIRNESIGDYSWDTSGNPYSLQEPNFYYSDGYNEWSDADLMYELNGDYLNSNLSGDVYWYSAPGNVKKGLFDHNKVIKENYSKYIAEVVWHLGGIDTSKDRGTIYNMERSDENCEKNDGCPFGVPFVHRTSEWLGKVALIYYSDYLYSDGWMSSMNLGRSISPYSNANFVADINRNTIYPFCSAASPVHPSLYLISNLNITGNGTMNDPYIIK